MALTKDQKQLVVDEVSSLLEGSKMTIAVEYKGIGVKSLQQLRKSAKNNGTVIKVIKNRLVVKALQSNSKLKDVDINDLKGQLLYAFNGEDEVAPAQTLATFAKTNPSLRFVGAITAEGQFMSPDEV